MDATSLVVDFGDSSFDVAARLARRLYDQHGCFLAKNLFAADQLSPINTFVEALVDALFSRAGLIRPPGQALQERRPDRGAFADQHQRFGVGKASRERIDILDVVVPDGNVMAIELAEARQRTNGVMVVVQDGDFHEMPSSSRKDAQSTRLNPGVSSGGFPLWRGRPKPSIIFRRNGRDRTGLRFFSI